MVFTKVVRNIRNTSKLIRYWLSCFESYYKRCSKQSSSLKSKHEKFYKEAADSVWIVENKFRRSHALNEIRIPYIYSAYLYPESMSLDKLKKNVPAFYEINMLEVGCGGGICSEPLAELGFNVTAIDPIPEMISVAEDHLSKNTSLKNKCNLRYVNSSVEEFVKEHRGFFDAVVISDVLEHVPNSNKENFLRSCVECVKINGKVLITTFNSSIWILLMSKLFSMEPQYSYLPFSWHNGIRPDKLIHMLHNCGCVVMDKRGIIFNPYVDGFQCWEDLRYWYYMHAVRQTIVQ